MDKARKAAGVALMLVAAVGAYNGVDVSPEDGKPVMDAATAAWTAGAGLVGAVLALWRKATGR